VRLTRALISQAIAGEVVTSSLYSNSFVMVSYDMRPAAAPSPVFGLSGLAVRVGLPPFDLAKLTATVTATTATSSHRQHIAGTTPPGSA
jgi:hypothetical protein